MKRRGFLSFLGGAAVAGPTMAKQAVTGIEAMTLPAIPWEGPMEPMSSGIGVGMSQVANATWDEGKWLKDRIAQLTGMTDADRKERIATTSVTSFDPDLAANRSFSLATKVSMQKRRNFERQYEREHRGLLREMADYLKRQALS